MSALPDGPVTETFVSRRVASERQRWWAKSNALWEGYMVKQGSAKRAWDAYYAHSQTRP